MSDVIALNVGGIMFQTRKTTLSSSSSFLSSLVQYEYSSDGIFVDRDPAHFRHILNHLRGAPTYPCTVEGLEELCIEADFYSLTEVKSRVEEQKRRLEKNTVVHHLGIIASRLM